MDGNMVGDILSHCLVEQSIYERCRPFAMSQPSNNTRNVTKFFNTENFFRPGKNGNHLGSLCKTYHHISGDNLACIYLTI